MLKKLGFVDLWIVRKLHRVEKLIKGKKNENVIEEGKDFVEVFRRVIASMEYDHDHIFNMDQTPFFFEATSNCTLEQRGKRTIAVKAHSSYADYRVTAALCISASGKKLPPYLIFKGKCGARVFKEVRKDGYCPGVVCSAQESAWMDQAQMESWIDDVWIPYTRNIGPCLPLLDQYKVHMTSVTRSKLESAGTVVYFVPPGYPIYILLARTIVCIYLITFRELDYVFVSTSLPYRS